MAALKTPPVTSSKLRGVKVLTLLVLPPIVKTLGYCVALIGSVDSWRKRVMRLTSKGYRSRGKESSTHHQLHAYTSFSGIRS